MAKIRYEKLHDDTKLPTRATPGSAGYDLYAHLNRLDIMVLPREYALDGPVKRRLDALPTSKSPSGWKKGILLRPGDKAIIPLGFKAALEDGYEAQIRPRSGASFKTGLDIPNAPGTIDPDYRGEWGVIVKNASGHDLTIQHGDRIAQMVVSRFEVVEEEVVESLEETARAGGFGSTGVS